MGWQLSYPDDRSHGPRSWARTTGAQLAFSPSFSFPSFPSSRDLPVGHLGRHVVGHEVRLCIALHHDLYVVNEPDRLDPYSHGLVCVRHRDHRHRVSFPSTEILQSFLAGLARHHPVDEETYCVIGLP